MIMRDRIQFFSTYDMSISHYLWTKYRTRSVSNDGICH